MLLSNPDGLSLYAAFLIRRLIDWFSDQALITVVVTPDAPARLPIGRARSRVAVTGMPYERGGARLWQRYSRRGWDAFIGALRPTVYIGASFVPVRLPIPQAVVVHDLLPTARPALVAREKTAFFEQTFGDVAEHVTRVLVPSHVMEDEVRNALGLPADRTQCLYPDIASIISRIGRSPRDVVRSPTLLMVGVKCARKNVTVVLDALVLFRESGHPIPHLTLVGNQRADVVPLDQLILERNLTRELSIAGYVSDAALRRHYRRCAALVFPSEYEGFGIPLVEALASRTAVVCADQPTSREVLGSGGAFLSPTPAAFAASIHSACLDPHSVDSRYCKQRLEQLAATNTSQLDTLRHWIATKLTRRQATA